VTNLGLVVTGVVQFYVIIIIVYVLMSWLPMNGGIVYDVYSVLGSLVEPYLGIFRRFIPPLGGMDISPIVAIILLQVLGNVLAGMLS